MAPSFRISSRQLTRRFLVLLFAFSIAVTVIISAIQLSREFDRDIDAVHAQLAQIRKVNLNGLAQALWTKEDVQVDTLLSGIMRLPHIASLRLYEEGAVVSMKGRTPKQRRVMENLPIVYHYGGKAYPLGRLEVTASLEGAYDRLWARFWDGLLFNAAQSFLIVGFAFWLLNTMILRHLFRVVDYVTAFDPEHDRTALILDNKRGRGDELDALADAVDGLTERVHGTIDTLQQSTNDIALARDEAERANLAKSNFLSAMSHELRTPLNAIIGFGELLKVDPVVTESPERADAIDHIARGGRHLLELVNQVLDMAKIDSGKLSVSIERVDPNPVLADCLTLTDSLAREKGVRQENKCAGKTLPAVRADLTRMRQVLLNFVSNAIKYNRPGGTVVVACEKTRHDKIRFVIADSGIGIPEDRQNELFVPFNRLAAEHGDIEGTGIGLSITRELVHLMGGVVGFSSIEGEGSTFWFELPLARGDEPSAVLHGAPSTANMPLGMLPKCRILYVEDNPANRDLMAMVLQGAAQVTLVMAQDAEQGLAMVDDGPPDLIFMDINLPGMSGIEALEILKNSPATAAIPVVAVSANAMKDDIQAGLDAGFERYITKPFKVTDVLSCLHQVLVGAPEDEVTAPPGAEPSVPVPGAEPVVDDGGGLDPAMLAQVRRNADAMPPRYLDVLARQWEAAEALIGDVAAGLKDGDYKAAETAAHTAKNSAATFGASALAGLCQEMEQACRTEDGAAAALGLERITAEYARINGSVRRFLDSLG